MTSPVPLLGWDADRPTWLKARQAGIGASDISAILGFSTHSSPWKVWAEKTGTYQIADDPSDASDLGTELEPWLLDKAAQILGVPVTRTEHQLYAHPHNRWRMCSPDGVTADGRGVQLKTAGLATGHGPPKGWDDGAVPLGYELQCRWERLVMGWDTVELVALVANRGVLHRTITPDPETDLDLLAQVTAWHTRHIVEGHEPPLGAPDSALLGVLYPQPTGNTVDLPPDAADLVAGYRRALDAEGRAKQEKEMFGAQLKRLLGAAEAGRLAGEEAVTWRPVRGKVSWKQIVTDLCEEHGLTMPDEDSYRGDSSRQLRVREW